MGRLTEIKTLNIYILTFINFIIIKDFYQTVSFVLKKMKPECIQTYHITRSVQTKLKKWVVPDPTLVLIMDAEKKRNARIKKMKRLTPRKLKPSQSKFKQLKMVE